MDKISPCRIPAPPMDQFNYALKALGDQSMHLVIAFEGLLEERRLQKAVEAMLTKVPVLGSRFVECSTPFWERLSRTDSEALVQIHHSIDSQRDLPAILAIPVDPASGPQICIHLLRSKNKDTLCITVHHAAMDARGLLACTRMLAECYRNSACCSSGMQAETTDRSLKTVLSHVPVPAPTSVLPAPKDPPAGWVFPAGPGGGGTRDFALRTLPASRLAAIKQAGKQQDATVNDVLLAAYFQALCASIRPPPVHPVPVMVSIDLRRYLCSSQVAPLKDLICNQSVAFAVYMQPGTLSRNEMIVRARDAMREYMKDTPGIDSAVDLDSFGYGRFGQICERVRSMKVKYAALHANPPFLGNIGIIPEEVVAFSHDLPVINAFVAGIVIDPPGVALGVTTFRDRLTLAIGFGSPAIPHATMEQFMDSLVSYLPGE